MTLLYLSNSKHVLYYHHSFIYHHIQHRLFIYHYFKLAIAICNAKLQCNMKKTHNERFALKLLTAFCLMTWASTYSYSVHQVLRSYTYRFFSVALVHFSDKNYNSQNCSSSTSSIHLSHSSGFGNAFAHSCKRLSIIVCCLVVPPKTPRYLFIV